MKILLDWRVASGDSTTHTKSPNIDHSDTLGFSHHLCIYFFNIYEASSFQVYLDFMATEQEDDDLELGEPE